MALKIVPREGGFGAHITGLNLDATLSRQTVSAIRQAWLTHQVVSFPDQPMSPSALQRFSLLFGNFGDDPYVAPLAKHAHVLEVRREPNEAVPPFGSAWHSDWSFQASPPAATMLHAKIIPSCGGDTLFADGCAALTALDTGLRQVIEDLTAIHSARRPYSHQGYQATGGDRRSMRILPSDEALATQEHPIIRTHPETGRQALWVNPVYTVGIKGLSGTEGAELLERLFAHYIQDQFIYRHRWSANMLTMWDNRSVMHRALGGYDGQRRVMHRTTIAGDPPFGPLKNQATQ